MKLIGFLLGLAAVVLIVSGFVLGRSASFKEECLAHKETGASLGWYKNTVCDADFTIQTGN